MTQTTISIKDEKITKYLKAKNMLLNNNIFDYLINISGDVYRQVKSRSTLKIKINECNYFIKKHYPISIFEFIKNISNFKNPFDNANNEYRAILALKRLNINTMDVVAIANRSNYKLKNKIKNIINKKIGATSFLVTKSIEPNIELDKFCVLFKNDKGYFKLKRLFIKHISEITRKIHLNGLNHRDYYLCHFLLKLDGLTEDNVRVNLFKINNNASSDAPNNLSFNESIEDKLLRNIHLIDLHRMQIRAVTPERYILKDLSAILFSVRNLKVSKTDKLRFIKNYINISDREKFRTFMRNENKFWRKIQSKADGLKEKG